MVDAASEIKMLQSSMEIAMKLLAITNPPQSDRGQSRKQHDFGRPPASPSCQHWPRSVLIRLWSVHPSIPVLESMNAQQALLRFGLPRKIPLISRPKHAVFLFELARSYLSLIGLPGPSIADYLERERMA